MADMVIYPQFPPMAIIMVIHCGLVNTQLRVPFCICRQLTVSEPDSTAPETFQKHSIWLFTCFFELYNKKRVQSTVSRNQITEIIITEYPLMLSFFTYAVIVVVDDDKMMTMKMNTFLLMMIIIIISSYQNQFNEIQ